MSGPRPADALRHAHLRVQLGVHLPGLAAYDHIAEALASDVGKRKVFLQTASPVALARFQQLLSSVARIAIDVRQRSPGSSAGGKRNDRYK